MQNNVIYISDEKKNEINCDDLRGYKNIKLFIGGSNFTK